MLQLAHACAGPSGLPFLGHVFVLASTAWHWQLRQWSIKYKGLFKVWTPFSTTVVVSDPQAVHNLLRLTEKQAVKDKGYYKSIDEVMLM